MSIVYMNDQERRELTDRALQLMPMEVRERAIAHGAHTVCHLQGLLRDVDHEAFFRLGFRVDRRGVYCDSSDLISCRALDQEVRACWRETLHRCLLQLERCR